MAIDQGGQMRSRRKDVLPPTPEGIEWEERRQAFLVKMQSRIGPRDTIADLIQSIISNADEIVESEKHSGYLSKELSWDVVCSAAYLFGSIPNVDHWASAPEIGDIPGSDEDIAIQTIIEVRDWALEFAERWHLAPETAVELEDLTLDAEVPVGWYDLSSTPTLRRKASEATDAIEAFLRLWQRCKIVRSPQFAFDEAQRHKLVQLCEALIGALKADMVERSLADNVAKRGKIAEFAIAAVIAIASGAAGGIATGVVDKFSSSDKIDAENTQIAAQNMSACLNMLDKTLSGLPPVHAPASGPTAPQQKAPKTN